ncbi:hypothetical protein DSO57_1038114 [Entomophthora muscae]|uniref:Uncharacterized protein n=1 Tax=Entomophthora muscae TaxID=34485 RepID=A0ACC2T9V7_9FUNG|nr:hypothetical protein DSO57_1038114 [Entomophthora muscae]
MSMKREAKLSTGATIPMVGLGTWRSEPNKVGEAVKSALKAGYRHIDCAWIYFNEAEVGNAIKGSGIKREDLFITSKLWNSFHHPDRVAAGFNETLKNLQVDYLDLYLIHWPLSHPEGQHGFQKNEDGTPKEETGYTTADTWKALEALVDSGKVKHIGLSNFTQSKIEKVLETARIPQPFSKLSFIHILLSQSFSSTANPKIFTLLPTVLWELMVSPRYLMIPKSMR